MRFVSGQVELETSDGLGFVVEGMSGGLKKYLVVIVVVAMVGCLMMLHVVVVEER